MAIRADKRRGWSLFGRCNISFVKDTFFGGAEKKAGKVQARAAEAGVEEQRRQFDITQEQLAPFREAGLGALERQQQFLGLAGPEAQQEAFAAFAESPGQRFLRERGQRSLLRNASAIGGLGGGNVRSALQQQGIGFAQQQFGEQLRQLGGISGTGQQTAVEVGRLGAQTAQGISSGLQAAGQARATGILGQAQGRREGIGQLAQIAGAVAGSDRRLKTNIEKVGKLPSGLDWYKWGWTEEAKDIVGGQASEGVIAQEAQEKFPEAISMVKGFLHVDYRRIH